MSILRRVAKTLEGLDHIGMVSHLAHQPIIECTILDLALYAGSAGLGERVWRRHPAVPAILGHWNPVLLIQPGQRLDMSAFGFDDAIEGAHVAESLQHGSVGRARFVLVLQRFRERSFEGHGHGIHLHSEPDAEVNAAASARQTDRAGIHRAPQDCRAHTHAASTAAANGRRNCIAFDYRLPTTDDRLPTTAIRMPERTREARAEPLRAVARSDRSWRTTADYSVHEVRDARP